MRFRPILIATVIAWGAAVAAGFLYLLHYKAAPGGAGTLGSHWPAGTRVIPDPARTNLILLAHPRCPCTRASLAELEQIMARCQGRTAAHVLFYRPAVSSPGWEQTDLWHRAAAIPGVSVCRDEDGREARRFGGATSGHVVLYNRRGQLLFSGGITGARGHAGDNVGRSAVIALLTASAADRKATPVFGCPLLGPDAACVAGGEPCDR
jgi:hypothetical protein